MLYPGSKNNQNVLPPSPELHLPGSQRAPLKAKKELQDRDQKVVLPNNPSVNMQLFAELRLLASPAATRPTTAPAKSQLAIMLDELREHGREAGTAIKYAETEMDEAMSAGKEARHVVKKVKGLAMEAKREALRMAERAKKEKKEALDTKNEAIKIGQRYRYVN